MTLYLVDDEPLQLKMLQNAAYDANPGAKLFSFSCAEDVFAEIDSGRSRPDVVFTDIELPDMNGLTLAANIKKRIRSANIVFVTGFSKYTQEAYALRPSGYIMKPVSKEKILTELVNLRNPPARMVPAKRIRVQCFGDFEIFADGIPVSFNRTKSKELLAYLVDRRGVKCSASSIAAVLWDDGVYNSARQKLLSIIRADMIKSLRKVGADNIIKNDRQGISVVPDEFDCDYYMAISGDIVSVNSFIGEYMSAYSWAEFTTASLTTMLSR